MDLRSKLSQWGTKKEIIKKKRNSSLLSMSYLLLNNHKKNLKINNLHLLLIWDKDKMKKLLGSMLKKFQKRQKGQDNLNLRNNRKHHLNQTWIQNKNLRDPKNLSDRSVEEGVVMLEAIIRVQTRDVMNFHQVVNVLTSNVLQKRYTKR